MTVIEPSLSTKDALMDNGKSRQTLVIPVVPPMRYREHAHREPSYEDRVHVCHSQTLVCCLSSVSARLVRVVVHFHRVCVGALTHISRGAA